MKKKVSLILFTVILAIMTVFTGCGKESPASDGDENAAVGDYEALNYDNYGREIVVKQMPQKVLTLGPNCSELLVALGLGDISSEIRWTITVEALCPNTRRLTQRFLN